MMKELEPKKKKMVHREIDGKRYLLFSEPDFIRSPASSANRSGRNLESDANNFFGAVSKLFILCPKNVYWNLSFSGALATVHTCSQIVEHIIVSLTV